MGILSSLKKAAAIKTTNFLKNSRAYPARMIRGGARSLQRNKLSDTKFPAHMERYAARVKLKLKGLRNRKKYRKTLLKVNRKEAKYNKSLAKIGEQYRQVTSRKLQNDITNYLAKRKTSKGLVDWAKYKQNSSKIRMP